MINYQKTYHSRLTTFLFWQYKRHFVKSTKQMRKHKKKNDQLKKRLKRQNLRAKV